MTHSKLLWIHSLSEAYLKIPIKKLPAQRHPVQIHVDSHQAQPLPVHQEPFRLQLVNAMLAGHHRQPTRDVSPVPVARVWKTNSKCCSWPVFCQRETEIEFARVLPVGSTSSNDFFLFECWYLSRGLFKRSVCDQWCELIKSGCSQPLTKPALSIVIRFSVDEIGRCYGFLFGYDCVMKKCFFWTLNEKNVKDLELWSVLFPVTWIIKSWQYLELANMFWMKIIFRINWGKACGDCQIVA